MATQAIPCDFDAILLAAGAGSRMHSHLPKALHRLGGKSMLAHLLDTLGGLQARVHLVVSPDLRTHLNDLGDGPDGGLGGALMGDLMDDLRGDLEGKKLTVALQQECLGTGHAVLQALPGLAPEGVAVVLYADVPLIRQETIAKLVARAAEGSLALLTQEMDDPTGYGRILRDPAICGIVEERDATDRQRAIREVSTGLFACPTRCLADFLPRLSNDNRAGEYYLTDVVALAAGAGLTIEALQPEDATEVLGVNSRGQLAAAERACQRRRAAHYMAQGLQLADPERFDVRGELEFGADCFVDINAIFEGRVGLGDRVQIGPGCLLRNCDIGEDATIEAYTVLDGARVGARCRVGPFARIRPATELGDDVRVGNFVETKNARLGTGAKASHLTYLGDADIGTDTNIGAGVITCNYDGTDKHPTHIGDGAFIGSNASLVAPLKLGKGVVVGAGSVVTEDVPEGGLGIARSRQRNVENWSKSSAAKSRKKG